VKQNIIIREINELRMKINNNKEKVTHDIENLRKKNQTEVQTKIQGHSSRLEQAEHRLSEFEDKMEIKGKLKRY
jgi:siderophore synthetase component